MTRQPARRPFPVLTLLLLLALAGVARAQAAGTPLLAPDDAAKLDKAARIMLQTGDNRIDAARQAFDPADSLSHWSLPVQGEQPVLEGRADAVLKALRELTLDAPVAVAPEDDVPAAEAMVKKYALDDHVSLLATWTFGRMVRATDDNGAPMSHHRLPLFVAMVDPLIGVVFSAPQADGSRYLRVARLSAATGDLAVGREIYQLPAARVPAVLVDSDLGKWMDLTLVNRQLRNLDPAHIYRVEGRDTVGITSWQNVHDGPLTVNNWKRSYSSPGPWRFSESRRTMFSDQPGKPARANVLAGLIDKASSLHAIDFLGEVNDANPRAKEPWLQVTLYHLGSLEFIAHVCERDLQMQLWLLLYKEMQDNGGQQMITAGKLLAAAANRIPRESLDDLLVGELAEGRISARKKEAADPAGLETITLPSAEGPLEVAGFRWQLNKTQLESFLRGMRQAYLQMFPEGILTAQQFLTQARERELHLDANATPAARQRAREETAKALAEYEDAMIHRFGQAIDLWIEQFKDADGKTRYRIATNTTNPPFAFWYELSFNDAMKLKHLVQAARLEPPSAPAVDAGNPVVRLETNFGNIDIELYEDDAPNTVANFVELVEAGFYDGLRSHRVRKDFVIQAGCPSTCDALTDQAGEGDPGYEFADEAPNEKKFDRAGIVAMANAGPDTNGCQFFITLAALPKLDSVMNDDGTVKRHYTIFGSVKAGMDVVNRIAEVKVGPQLSPDFKEESRPLDEVLIRRAVVLQKRDHEYHVTKLDKEAGK
ncbi:MAG: peptidylprolyl isomerase [Planctomycetota bacterium]